MTFTTNIPEPEVRVLAQDRVEWLVPPTIMAVTPGKWTDNVEGRGPRLKYFLLLPGNLTSQRLRATKSGTYQPHQPTSKSSSSSATIPPSPLPMANSSSPLLSKPIPTKPFPGAVKVPWVIVWTNEAMDIDTIADSDDSDSHFLCFEGLPFEWEACQSWFYRKAVSSHIVWINWMFRTISNSHSMIWLDLNSNEDACKLCGYLTHRTMGKCSLINGNDPLLPRRPRQMITWKDPHRLFPLKHDSLRLGGPLLHPMSPFFIEPELRWRIVIMYFSEPQLRVLIHFLI
ncbi:uncharacterized protein LACBIDRAFT_328881 [Laccaria bicolor S238N-H82]|uniref:Predicted protein n=1 Tax=Laccaria bicolor (strain S238N-H82 / ATCC MYA-4686) TaxID=486041 RepID=B0DGA6_LACBS|nr:uncharacterized protein LACBIDRAFT_328881 [Laccaria bicolor S238N-H82]EDR06606.1 predicted protein [Laccaria bicolor S238N-H82]|eukprot:XP_001882978.1 predicted protein [Laccaria bicolor S238N-H82]